MAVVFITRMEGDKSINEGLCIKCAKEMNIKPVTDLLDKMGITDEQLDAMDDQMAGLMDTFGDSLIWAVLSRCRSCRCSTCRRWEWTAKMRTLLWISTIRMR